jgi:hypothetical protein
VTEETADYICTINSYNNNNNPENNYIEQLRAHNNLSNLNPWESL